MSAIISCLRVFYSINVNLNLVYFTGGGGNFEDLKTLRTSQIFFHRVWVKKFMSYQS